MFLLCSYRLNAQWQRRVKSRGDLSKARLDREWPHQVTLPASRCGGDTYWRIAAFCRALSLAPRTHTFVRGDAYHIVFCFVEKADAEAFAESFEGRMIDPTERPRWPGRQGRRGQ